MILFVNNNSGILFLVGRVQAFLKFISVKAGEFINQFIDVTDII